MRFLIASGQDYISSDLISKNYLLWLSYIKYNNRCRAYSWLQPNKIAYIVTYFDKQESFYLQLSRGIDKNIS